MATAEAVLNRQANRQAKSEWKRQRDAERRHHEDEVAVRMTRRFFPPILYPEGPPLIVLSYRYWQARRCDWDALSRTVCVNAGGKSCHPMDSMFWFWWTRCVHGKQRNQLVRMSNFRLERARRA